MYGIGVKLGIVTIQLFEGGWCVRMDWIDQRWNQSKYEISKIGQWESELSGEFYHT